MTDIFLPLPLPPLGEPYKAKWLMTGFGLSEGKVMQGFLPNVTGILGAQGQALRVPLGSKCQEGCCNPHIGRRVKRR